MIAVGLFASLRRRMCPTTPSPF
nr:unnamed protein product [Callosobruchus analis]